jgi:hypothetical protein
MDADDFDLDGFGTSKHFDGRPPEIYTEIFNRNVSTGVFALIEFAQKIISFAFLRVTSHFERPLLSFTLQVCSTCTHISLEAARPTRRLLANFALQRASTRDFSTTTRGICKTIQTTLLHDFLSSTHTTRPIILSAQPEI